MSVSRLFTIATLSTLVLFSCTKEEITPVTPSPTIEEYETTINGNEISSERQDQTQEKYTVARAEITACGNSFYVDVRIGQIPANDSYNYEIRNSETNELVDSGTIGHSNNTNAILNPCTQYDFKFFGSHQVPTHSVTQRISSDGCGGKFSC